MSDLLHNVISSDLEWPWNVIAAAENLFMTDISINSAYVV